MKERMISTDVVIESLSDSLAHYLGYNMQAVIGISGAASNLNRRLANLLIGWSQTEFEEAVAKKVQEKRRQPPMLGPGGPLT